MSIVSPDDVVSVVSPVATDTDELVVILDIPEVTVNSSEDDMVSVGEGVLVVLISVRRPECSLLKRKHTRVITHVGKYTKNHGSHKV